MMEESFDAFGLDPDILDGLHSMGFKKPTPVQSQTLPIILNNRDLIACAQTGTGKTAAYLLPVIHHILVEDHKPVSTLILAPTRELALQIDQQVEGLGYYTGVGSTAVYGGGDGSAWERQKFAITNGSDIVIATPGRLLSFLSSGIIQLNHLKFLILDEADRMLDMGFYEDIMRIISVLPKNRQSLLFSATMPEKIRMLAKTILNNPVEINLAVSKPANLIEERFYSVYEPQKEAAIKAMLNRPEFTSIIIFSSKKENVKKLARTLQKEGYSCEAFHADHDQTTRESIMRGFKSGRIRILVGTDVISRGIDIEGIDLVMNFDLSPDPEDYIHRIGRTGRAERSGLAITLVSPDEQRKIQRINKLRGKEAHWFHDLIQGEIPPLSDCKTSVSSDGKKNQKRKKKKTGFNKPRPA